MGYPPNRTMTPNKIGAIAVEEKTAQTKSTIPPATQTLPANR